VPSSMQGTSLLSTTTATPGQAMAGEDIIRERLRGLGYIG
jgi:hypothetical protein